MRNELIIEKAHMEDLPHIIEFVTATLIKQGMDKVIFQAESAVDEACTNIIKYAYDGNPGFIKLSVNKKDDIMIITVNDRGKPFDPNSIAMPDIKSNLDHRKTGGLGIFIIKKLMDSISHHYDQQTGNTLIMKKKLVK